MDGGYGIDSKPRPRTRARRRASERSSAIASEHNDDGIDDADAEQMLNVRVKERESDAGRRSRLGGIFKEPPAAAIKGLLQKEPARELKESIKRPLTGLFRKSNQRPSSGAVGRKEARTEPEMANMEVISSTYASGAPERSISPEIPNVERQIVREGVARAPNVSMNRVAAMFQLDNVNAKTAHLVKLDDIDLSLLARYLCMEDEVKDEAVPWTWDYVFANISTEMREEWALDDDQDDDGYERSHPQ